MWAAVADIMNSDEPPSRIHSRGTGRRCLGMPRSLFSLDLGLDRFGRRFVFGDGFFGATVSPLELFVEFIDTSGSVDEFYRSGVIRVAIRANFHHDFRFGTARFKRIAAAANDLAILIFWMDTFAHDLPFLSRQG